MTDLILWDHVDEATVEVLSEKEDSRANGRTFIRHFDGVVTCVAALIDLKNRNEKDKDFFDFKTTWENDAGEVMEIRIPFSPVKWKFNGHTFYCGQLKNLLRSVGFGEVSLSSLEGRKEVNKILRPEPTGVLPKWLGLKLQIRFGHKPGTFHIKEDGHPDFVEPTEAELEAGIVRNKEPFVLCDHNGTPHVFPFIKVLDENPASPTHLDYLKVENTVLRGATKDQVISRAAQINLKDRQDIKFSELLAMRAVPGANDELLKRFEPGWGVAGAKPVVVDPQKLVTEVKSGAPSDLDDMP